MLKFAVPFGYSALGVCAWGVGELPQLHPFALKRIEPTRAVGTESQAYVL